LKLGRSLIALGPLAAMLIIWLKNPASSAA
jgi:hypothetical protein